jgi:UDP-glucose:(heptosyl)LPS alpha-1,3-glucosyltransferase
VNIGIAVHRYSSREGTGGYVVELLPRLARAHRVTLYAAQVEAPVPEGVEVVPVPAVMVRAYTAILSFPVALRLVRRRHDLFHAQGWVAPAAEVVTAHIVMAAWRDAAHRAHIPTPLGERTLGPLVQAREASLLRRARRVIAPSAKARDEIARYYGRTTGVSVIHHGFSAPDPSGSSPTSAAAAARRALGLPPDGTIALFVGDLRKGFDVALEAVRQVPGVRLAVATHTSRGPMLERAARAGVAERVHWLGSLERTAPAYAAADFLLHPTIYDSFGLVVAEAMASGLPVVVTRAAGVCELIAHGESGWIVDGDPLAGTLAAVQALAQDRALRQRLGVGGRAVAARRTWDRVAEETLAAYQEASAGT